MIAGKALCCLFCFCIIVGSVSGLSVRDSNEPFIGWTGETYQPGAAKLKVPRHGKSPWVELVSWRPRVFIHHNFLTDEECAHIKRLAAPVMKRSTVVGASGKSVLDDYRTSYGSFVKRRVDEVVASIEDRLAKWVKIPEVHAEDTQVLRYALGQQYKPHMDTLTDPVAGVRVATVLMYLNDVEEGGETAFPESDQWVHPDLRKRMGPFSNCTKGGVAFRPRKGDALLFWSIKPDGRTEDSAAMHTGCPVLKGVKWTATKWIHAKPFRAETFGVPMKPDPDPGHCLDMDAMCKTWAEAGECKKNPAFMVGGDSDMVGRCRLSCGACKHCKKGDMDCYNANREKMGYLVYEPSEFGPDAVEWPKQ